MYAKIYVCIKISKTKICKVGGAKTIKCFYIYRLLFNPYIHTWWALCERKIASVLLKLQK